MGRAEIAFLIGGIAVAYIGYAHELRFPSGFDAIGYVDSAKDIASGGLFSNYVNSGVRTYGYPWILSLILRICVRFGLPFTATLFHFQLALYILASWFVRRSLLPASRMVAAFAFCGLMFNYYALLYTSVSLTESLSLTTLLLVVGCWIAMWQRRDQDWPIVIGSLAVGFAIMIRPANVFAILPWLAGCGYLVIGDIGRPAHRIIRASALAMFIAVPMIPQVANNALFHQNLTPLVAGSLGNRQQVGSIQFLKYATALPPVPKPAVLYSNPLYRAEPIARDAPLRWYAEHPLRGSATLLLHIFNLTDQDLLFTYSRDLDPWYRWPLSVLNHATAGLGILGLLLAIVNVVASRERRPSEALAALMLLVLANATLYSMTVVEMRFGLTLLAVLFPFAGYAGWWLIRVSKGWRRAAAIVGALSYVAIALLLSTWVRQQSPEIREAMSGATPYMQPSCPAKFDFSVQPLNGTGWSIPEKQPDGSFRMWMASTRASMDVPTTCSGRVNVSLLVASFMTDEILSGLRLRVNGTEVPLVLSRSPGGPLSFSSGLDLPKGTKLAKFEITAPATKVPPGGSRELAVMFEGLTIEPADNAAPRR